MHNLDECTDNICAVQSTTGSDGELAEKNAPANHIGEEPIAAFRGNHLITDSQLCSTL